jgi:hypothetical protein
MTPRLVTWTVTSVYLGVNGRWNAAVDRLLFHFFHQNHPGGRIICIFNFFSNGARGGEKLMKCRNGLARPTPRKVGYAERNRHKERERETIGERVCELLRLTISSWRESRFLGEQLIVSVRSGKRTGLSVWPEKTAGCKPRNAGEKRLTQTRRIATIGL